MSNLVIVAIPSEDSEVWRYSSEKVPHMTLLFLGPVGANQNVAEIANFLQHASTTMLKRFYADVERRGMLGDDEADVLFFRKKYFDDVLNFRSALLLDPNIRTAYDSVEQYPEWIPHLTMGYPNTPAKPDEREYPGIHGVHFDRIALWFGDYEGVEFQLQEYDYGYASVAQSGLDAVQSIMHYGVKGMRWGQRKTETVSDGKGGVKKVTAKKADKMDKEFEKFASSNSAWIQIHNQAAAVHNAVDVPRINNSDKWKNEDFRDTDWFNPSPKHAEYAKEHQDAFIKRVEDSAASMGVSKTGRLRLKITTDEYGGWDVSSAPTDKVKHADDDLSFHVKVTYDSMNRIAKIEPEDSVAQAMAVGEDFLEHFGVKGMRWGQRKQKSGGYQPVETKQKGKKLKTQGGKGAPVSEDAVRARSIGQVKKASGINALSNKDLQDYATRLQLEQNVKRLEVGEKSGAKQFIASLLKNAAKQQAQQVVNQEATTQVAKVMSKRK